MIGGESDPRRLSAWTQWHSFDFMAIERRRNHRSHSRILEMLASGFGERRFSILDIGVLSTVTLEKLNETPELRVDYVGVDISLPIIRDAQRRHPEVSWIHGDIAALPLNDSSFDCVIVRHVLEHVEDPIRAIQEVGRVAREMAIFCFFLPPEEHERRRRDVYEDGVIFHNVWSRSAILDELRLLFSSVDVESVDDWYRPNELFVCMKRISEEPVSNQAGR